MSSSVCYITTTTRSSETSDVSALFTTTTTTSTNTTSSNSKKKSSLSNRSSSNYANSIPQVSAKTCAVSYLTQLNTNLNSNQNTDSNNNNMLLNTTLEILNELHQQQQQQQQQNRSNPLINITNCNSNSGSNIVINESDIINLDLLSRNSNGTSSGTSSVISNSAISNQSNTPPQQSQKLKKKVQFISNEMDEMNHNKNEETTLIDPVILNISNSTVTDNNQNSTSLPIILNSVNKIQQIEINTIASTQMNDSIIDSNEQKNINIPIRINQSQQQLQPKPMSSIIRNKSLMTNSLNRNFSPSPSSPYSYSISLVNNSNNNNKRQSSASYRTNGDQINKSQTIPYLSSYSYAAAANRSYRNSDTKHHYQFVSPRQQFHQAISPSSSFQRALSPTNNSTINRFNNMRSSMTMPVIHRSSDMYSSTRSYQNTSLTFTSISEKDNPFRPEGELAREADEFVQKLKEKQEHDINQILNATISSTSPLPSPNSTLKHDTTHPAASLEHQSPKKVEPTPQVDKALTTQPASPSKQVDTVPLLTTPTKSNEPTNTTSTPVKNDSKPITNNTKKEKEAAANGGGSGEKKKTKPKCGCVIS